MRFASPSLQCIGTNTAMSSYRFNARGRNPWRRGFCDRPSSDGRGGGGPFVSGDSHLRTVRDTNYGYRQGYNADSWTPRGNPQQHFRPRPPPPPRPADHRNWIFSRSQPPPQCERFTVLSYNILADYLARDHRPKLYFHIPHHILDWEWRKRRLFLEFGLWAPDIMCLQEVDRFHDLEEELTIRGYTGIWKMRTGNAVDGCAIFWRTNRFQLRHEEHIEFDKLGLRDNIAQICVLESRIQIPAANPSASLSASSDPSRGVNQVVICNIHVLYNPKRGEIKLGQVRVLLDRAYAVSRIWNDAPVIICGDFNCTPKSPLYTFISEQKLSLSGLARDQVSGQYSASIYAPRPYVGSGLYRAQHSLDNSSEAKVVEQGICRRGTDNHLKSQNDIENVSLTEKLPPHQILTGMLDMSGKPFSDSRNINGNDMSSDVVAKEIDGGGMLDGLSGDTTSTQHRPVGPSQEKGESCKEKNEIPVNIGNVENQEVTPYCSQLNADASNELIHSLDLDSSSKGHKLSRGFTDSSAVETDTSKSYMETSVVPTMREDLTGHDISSDNMNAKQAPSVDGITESHSEMAPEKALFDGALLDKQLLDDFGTGVSSSDLVSGTSSAKVEVSALESMESSADLTTEEKVGTFISCQNICKINLSDSSTCGNSLNEVGGIMMGDAKFDGDHGNSNSAKMLARIEENVTLHDIDDYNISIEPNSEEASQISEKSGFTGGTHQSQSDDHSGARQGGSMVNDLCSLEENPDPNFYKELLGTEDACEYMEEAASTSCQIQPESGINVCGEQNFSSSPGHKVGKAEVNTVAANSTYLHNSGMDPPTVEVREDSSRPVAPSAAYIEKHSYNPYLWTPMEIEVASGSAGCTSVEHCLKLRSAYTDVEDYVGTEDSSREPQVTSYNRLFMGTVDYIWCSEGLQTVKVLDTIPKHVLQRTPGFPTYKWGSDHLALACQLAFTKGFQTTK